MMDTNKRQHRPVLYTLLLCLMMAAGLARIALTLTHDARPGDPLRGAQTDTVIIRRSVQLVTCAFQVLLARPGMTLLDAEDTAAVSGGYSLDGAA